MKNTVEFRAWDKKTKTFLFFTLTDAICGELKHHPWCRDAIKQQCIGVKDCDGRPIFEGDLLRTPHETVCEVIWSPPEFWIRCVETGESRIKLPSYLNQCEVIGNLLNVPIPGKDKLVYV